MKQGILIKRNKTKMNNKVKKKSFQKVLSNTWRKTKQTKKTTLYLLVQKGVGRSKT